MNELEKILNFYKNNIISIYLYGSYAVGDENEFSDYNLFLILNNYEFSKALSLKYPPFIFTKNELLNSLDTFPIEILDIKERGKLLYGEDFLRNVEIKKEDLIKQIEREIKEKLINFRRILNFEDKQIPIFILKTYKSLTSILRAILHVENLNKPKKRIYIYYEISKFLNFDYSIFLKIEEHLKEYPKNIEQLNEFSYKFYEFLKILSDKYDWDNFKAKSIIRISKYIYMLDNLVNITPPAK